MEGPSCANLWRIAEITTRFAEYTTPNQREHHRARGYTDGERDQGPAIPLGFELGEGHLFKYVVIPV